MSGNMERAEGRLGKEIVDLSKQEGLGHEEWELALAMRTEKAAVSSGRSGAVKVRRLKKFPYGIPWGGSC